MMAVFCNDLCHLFKGYIDGYAWYRAKGNKMCLTCNYQIKTTDIRCLCCKQKYRSKPRFYRSAKKRDIQNPQRVS
jgi:hypothetical protein